jgi:beta-N-acetylhexosaminidase
LSAPRALILGCSGTSLTAAERRLFKFANPLGFILFARNCETPEQVGALVAELRRSVSRPEAPVLIDQEGGRVQRLKPPRWRQAPAAAEFGALAARDLDAALAAVRLNHRLIAAELTALGIDADCVPVLDIPTADAHGVIGNRAFGNDPALVAKLGRAAADGLLAGGVLPVIKHIPGHGRATADSHHEMPAVGASWDELVATDFAPFKALADLPLAMTGHVLYRAVDAQKAATISPIVIDRVIRRHIGFDGLLISDDIGMQALQGGYAQRVAAILAAGCDIALHCSGKLDEMEDAVAAAAAMTPQAVKRWERARARLAPPAPLDQTAALSELDRLLA